MKKDGFIESSSFLFIGMMVGNVINYLFQLTMGRMLSVKTYGEMNTLMSILLVLSFPVSSITLFLTKSLSHNCALGRYETVKKFIAKTYKLVLTIGIITSIAGSLFSGLTSRLLKIDSILPVILLFMSTGVYVLVPINIAILQGFHRFKILSFITAAISLFKYAIGVTLVAAGFGLNGTIIGLMLSYVLTAYISYIPIRAELKNTRWSFNDNPSNASDVSLSFLIPVTVASLAFAILIQTDLLLVKYFFSPSEAGIFSSAAIIAKSLLYVPIAIVTTLLPMVASNIARAEKTISLIIKAFVITIVLSGGGTVVLNVFPETIISVFFGAKFLPASKIVGLYALAMLPMTLVMVLINYNIARDKTFFAYITLLCSFAQVAGIVLFHKDVATVLKVILTSGSFCLTVLLSLLALEYYRITHHHRQV
ncbi:MAG: oligosaccharide flippase family protein [Nitrospirae bacterium]|nr:oligosaccharide flippase family protein [Nitrospirota bacterium]